MSHVGYLRKFSFWWHEHEAENFELVIEVVLGPVASNTEQFQQQISNDETILKFRGVRSLKIAEDQMLSFVQIELYDVSEHQLEWVKFKVVEEENSLFSFLCAKCEKIQ
jgi:hypothetical protein